MKIKKFVGRTMQEAFDAVKKGLGSDAVILNTKTKKRNGVMGLLGKEMVEITASADVNILQDNPERKSKSYLEDLYNKNNTENTKKTLNPELSSSERGKSSQADRMLQYELGEIKSVLDDLVKRSKHSDLSHLSDELMDFYLMLLEQQVSESLSKDIVQSINEELSGDDLNNKAVIKEILKDSLVKLLRNAHPIELDCPAKKVALIGPTGVGKTTTIAKLAANFSLKEGKRVGLITIDTYRIAAVEQLRTYAEIINIPLEVVLTTTELKKALIKLKDRDLILIDTAGRSQKNTDQMDELSKYLEVMNPDEVHLVLSTVTNYNNVMDTINRFQRFNFDKLIFTKMDEAVNFGLVLNVIKNVSKSLSYITTGQNVPDDIKIGNAQHLVELLLGDKNHA